MRASKLDMPVVKNDSEKVVRQDTWGNMSVELIELLVDIDPAPVFKGLPDDRCQCPHWGYVLKGKLVYRYPDREEVYTAGDLYYVPPGHLPYTEAGSEYIEWSPVKELEETMRVVSQNLRSLKS
jgi:hypothetical protein